MIKPIQLNTVNPTDFHGMLYHTPPPDLDIVTTDMSDIVNRVNSCVCDICVQCRLPQETHQPVTQTTDRKLWEQLEAEMTADPYGAV